MTSALGLVEPPRATVWLHRSAEEKRRLVGAGHTSFTKPWLAEIHLQDEGAPHPLLRHELVHALAAAGAPWPLRVPARGRLLVNAGLVEGLAVAVEVPAGSWDVHQWARAMRDRGELPALSTLLAPAGFLGAPPARAYAAAGSFLRFLLTRHGAEVVRRAYASGDVAHAAGLPLAELEARWHRALDAVVVPPELTAAAERRFARGSLFQRACAREVAALEEETGRAAAARLPAAAEALARRALERSGGDPAALRTAAQAWRAAGEGPRAEALLEEVLRSEGRVGNRAALLQQLGDLRWLAGDRAGAAGRFEEALGAGPGPAEERALRARLAALADPGLAEALGPWLRGDGDPALALARVARTPGPLARYLLARAQLARGEPEAALRELAALDPAALPAPSLAAETRRMRAEALCEVGRGEDGVAAWAALAAEARAVGRGALAEKAEDAAARCGTPGGAGPR